MSTQNVIPPNLWVFLINSFLSLWILYCGVSCNCMVNKGKNYVIYSKKRHSIWGSMFIFYTEETHYKVILKGHIFLTSIEFISKYIMLYNNIFIYLIWDIFQKLMFLCWVKIHLDGQKVHSILHIQRTIQNVLLHIYIVYLINKVTVAWNNPFSINRAGEYEN